MTKEQAIKNLVSIAKGEIGYLEKKSNSNLAEKQTNVGNNNYTKYAADHAKWGTYHASKQGLPWCEQFVDWCFIMAFGFSKALEMTYQSASGYGAGCTESYNYYKAHNAIFSKPQIGDQIYFGKIGNLTHTGIVVDCDEKDVYTIEGNTSSVDNTVIANGGGVWRKRYALNNSKICGYGRPKWEAIMDETKNVTIKQYDYVDWKGGRIYSIKLSAIDRIEHITNPNGKGEYTTTMAEFTKWNGKKPTFFMNAELFNMKTYAAASGVRDNGVEALKGWQFGIGTNDYKTLLWQYGQSATAKEFIGGYPALISNGQKLDYPQPVGVDGKRTRMAYGYNKDTFFIIYTKQAITLDELSAKFLSIGALNAINVDGGGSISIVAPNHKYAQSRKIRGWLAIWLKDENTISNKPSINNKSTTPSKKQTVTLLKDNSASKGIAFITTASSLNMRNEDGTIISVLPKNTKCMWYGYYANNLPTMNGKFYYVVANGKTGFVSAQYIKRS